LCRFRSSCQEKAKQEGTLSLLDYWKKTQDLAYKTYLAIYNEEDCRALKLFIVNGDMGPAEVQHFCQLDDAGKNLMRSAVKQMDLSARAYHRVLKLGRTIADLAGEERIGVAHLAEAIQYRPRGIV
jgi:predicted ATPase with chaperone activity